MTDKSEITRVRLDTNAFKGHSEREMEDKLAELEELGRGWMKSQNEDNAAANRANAQKRKS